MFYDQLESLCKENDITVSRLTKQLGMSTGIITKWKDGAMPNGETILKFAEYFNTTTDYLLTGKLRSPDLCSEEIELLQCFRTLPDIGKEKVRSYIDGYISALATDKSSI